MSQPAPWRFRIKLSKGSLLLLHMAAVGHVWRDSKGIWVASTEHTKRVVDNSVQKMISQGVLIATYKDNFPKLTRVGEMYLKEHPVSELLQHRRVKPERGRHG